MLWVRPHSNTPATGLNPVKRPALATPWRPALATPACASTHGRGAVRSTALRTWAHTVARSHHIVTPFARSKPATTTRGSILRSGMERNGVARCVARRCCSGGGLRRLPPPPPRRHQHQQTHSAQLQQKAAAVTAASADGSGVALQQQRALDLFELVTLRCAM
ncbi:hypothetical protein PLESTB_000098200 [Pleodorina starrii]|uniref:Uncharacterized protein n=1 Tax=Pleodorina starrii TaxID=330485 RepID=A0A9W6BBD2_9CHLO|nr:hypothetical protein PLESTM_000094700 [Pleodorina starrii]GLC48441.1 hypothetical protein PLESTB_000098200 [Pleodorina starrii]